MMERNTEATTAAHAFDAATLGGARALGRDDLGRIAPGAKADLVLWKASLVADDAAARPRQEHRLQRERRGRGPRLRQRPPGGGRRAGARRRRGQRSSAPSRPGASACGRAWPSTTGPAAAPTSSRPQTYADWSARRRADGTQPHGGCGISAGVWQTSRSCFGVSLLAFAIMHVVPGDPVRLIAGPDAPESVVQRIRAELGLERPLHVQYLSFLGRALQGDLGRSLRSRAPVIDEILARFPATLELTTVSMLIAVARRAPARTDRCGAPRRPGSTTSSMGASLSSLSMPIFWVAIVAIWLFSLQLGWLPVSGRGGPRVAVGRPSPHRCCPRPPSPRRRWRSSAGSRARACSTCSAAST